MHSELPINTRSRSHRWMVTGFPLCGLVLLGGLMLRIGGHPGTSPAEPESTPIGSTGSHIVSNADASDSDRTGQSTTTMAPSEVQATSLGSTSDSKPLEVEFYGSAEAVPSDPIEPPGTLTDAELLSSLENRAVELDLYRDSGDGSIKDFPAYISQVSRDRSRLTAEIADLRLRVGRPTRINRGSQSLLDQVPGATKKMELAIADMQNRLSEQLMAAERYEPLRQWMGDRPDLQDLPISMGASCRLGDMAAEALNKVSTSFIRMRFSAYNEKRVRLRQSNAESRTAADFQPTLENANAALEESVHNDPEKFENSLRKFGYAHAIPALSQIMQGFNRQMRLQALNAMSNVSAPVGTTAIAQRAVFDPSSEVREAAVTELQNREPADFRPVLLSALRYVWAPAAQHAADALVAVNDQAARADLLDLAKEPDPSMPIRNESGGWSVHELTRVNHLRNCLLCHAPVIEANVKPTGAIPDPYQSIPVAYYAGSGGSRSALVRADVTYLRQDFSIVHEVDNHGPWPKQQRFDYFVRERQLSPTEAEELLARDWSDDYPQRKSVLYALQQLDAIGNRRVIASRN